MPKVAADYRPPPWPLRNRYVMSLLTTARWVRGVEYAPEDLEIGGGKDRDVVQLDWVRTGADRLVILVPGLEGNTRSSYMRGMARVFSRSGWDVVAYNYRGCDGRPNRTARTYHGADWRDLDAVVIHVEGGYAEVCLIGFSMGANIVLKYLATKESQRDSILAAAAFSPPCDFPGSVQRWETGFVNKRIVTPLALRSMRRKMQAKVNAGIVGRDVADSYTKVVSLAEADHFIHAPVNGYRSGTDYWNDASSKPLLDRIETPTLVVIAQDDFMVSEGSYPTEEAEQNDCIELQVPKHGSHVGFARLGRGRVYWSEEQASVFLSRHSALRPGGWPVLPTTAGASGFRLGTVIATRAPAPNANAARPIASRNPST